MKKIRKRRYRPVLMAVTLAAGCAWNAQAQTKAKAPDAAGGAEEQEVQKIKEKYWAGGDEEQVGVVQNRTYSKARKWTLGVSGGVMFADPFLSVKSAGLTAGYHFTEYFGVELIGWRLFTTGSSALEKLHEGGKESNTNFPRSYLGAEALWSIMYGKLSLVGKKIIYYDLHLIGGGGMVNTETGTDPAGVVGLGQRYYLSTNTSLRIDYRMMGYHEKIVEKEITSKLGQEVGTRMNYSHSITVGVDFHFGGSGDKK